MERASRTPGNNESTKRQVGPGKSPYCLHCHSPVPAKSADHRFCCRGCQFVYGLIHREGFDTFYELRDKRLKPLINYFTRKEDLNWIQDLPSFKSGEVRLLIEGVQCAACVWLIRNVAKRFPGLTVSINSSTSTILVGFENAQARAQPFFEALAEFGYRVRPLDSTGTTRPDTGLRLRMTIAVAIAMNVMMFSIAIYVGLSPQDGALFTVFNSLIFILATLSFLIGGSYFFQRAWRGLKRRVLHFDLPIALGILLAYSGSTWGAFFSGNQIQYFDSLSVFIALMLVGRYVQESVLTRLRASVVGGDALQAFRVRRLGHTIEDIPVSDVKVGDRLLVPPGGFASVPSILRSDTAREFSLQTLTGETTPQMFSPGDSIPAGARLLSLNSAELQAETNGKQNQLQEALMPNHSERSSHPFWHLVSQSYVILVLALTVAGFLLWIQTDVVRAVEVAIAIAVVTCPCGLGIAIPLSRALAAQKLNQNGVVQLDDQLFDNLLEIKNLVFDKTGTLTLAELTLENSNVLDTLSDQDRNVLFSATATSLHPVSQAVFQVLLNKNCRTCEVAVTEVPGQGLDIKSERDNYFFGKPAALKNDVPQDSRAVLRKNGVDLAFFGFREQLLEDAKPVLESVDHLGFNRILLSGDQKRRVIALGRALEFKNEAIFAEATPQDKLNIVRRFEPKQTLYLGDGLNDVPAMAYAGVVGVPLWDATTPVQKSGFYFLSSSLDWLPYMFRLARRLHRTTRLNLVFALIYNVLTVTLAMFGVLGPLACAIVMPVNSLLVIVLSTASISRNNLI